MLDLHTAAPLFEIQGGKAFAHLEFAMGYAVFDTGQSVSTIPREAIEPDCARERSAACTRSLPYSTRHNPLSIPHPTTAQTVASFAHKPFVHPSDISHGSTE